MIIKDILVAEEEKKKKKSKHFIEIYVLSLLNVAYIFTGKVKRLAECSPKCIGVLVECKQCVIYVGKTFFMPSCREMK